MKAWQENNSITCELMLESLLVGSLSRSDEEMIQNTRKLIILETEIAFLHLPPSSLFPFFSLSLSLSDER